MPILLIFPERAVVSFVSNVPIIPRFITLENRSGIIAFLRGYLAHFALVVILCLTVIVLHCFRAFTLEYLLARCIFGTEYDCKKILDTADSGGA